jgi:hypothetical protein
MARVDGRIRPCSTPALGEGLRVIRRHWIGVVGDDDVPTIWLIVG